MANPLNAITDLQFLEIRAADEAAECVRYLPAVPRRISGTAACMHCKAPVPVEYEGTALDIPEICTVCGKQTWIDLRKLAQKGN